MSTTNENGDPNVPSSGLDKPDDHAGPAGRDPNAPPTELHQPDDHAGDTVATEQMKRSIERGHEDDRISVKPILWVALAITVTCAIAYLVVTIVVPITLSDKPTVRGNVLRSERSERTLDERFADINSRGTDATVRAPRLEGLMVPEENLGLPNARPQIPARDDPRNTPHYHPEDLVPGTYPGLNQTEWIKEGTSARVPMLEAIAAFAASDAAKRKAGDKEGFMFPMRSDIKPSDSSDRPSESNGGQALGRIER